jgi:hypothetical protein
LGRGITNSQASYLAALQRELGERYLGAGMSRLEASEEIEACKGRLAARTKQLREGIGGRWADRGRPGRSAARP